MATSTTFQDTNIKSASIIDTSDELLIELRTANGSRYHLTLSEIRAFKISLEHLTNAHPKYSE